MPPARERRVSRKVRENTSPAPLQTPRATPRVPSRAPSRPRAPRRSTSGRLYTQDGLNKAEARLRVSRAVGTLLTPGDGTPGTQVVRDSVLPPTLNLPELSSSDPPISDVEMLDLQPPLLQSIENMSDKEEEEEEEEEEQIDYDIEWKVLLGKDPIISDIIGRSDFRFVRLCKNAKNKAQEYTNKKKRDAEVINCKA